MSSEQKNYNLNLTERNLIIEALEAAGTIIGAARLLGLSKDQTKRRIAKHGIKYKKSRSIVIDNTDHSDDKIT